MSTIPAAGGNAVTSVSRSATGVVASPAASAATSAPTTRSGAGPAVVVELSDAAKAVLTTLRTEPSFAERVQTRTDALATKLSKAFAAYSIPPDSRIALQVDASGHVTTDSPYKKTIDKIFADDPDLAKEVKDVASLNTLRAAQKALELYDTETKAARTTDERDAATNRYTARSMTIQAVSGGLTLKDGQLSSVAMDYVDALAGPNTKAIPELIASARRV